MILQALVAHYESRRAAGGPDAPPPIGYAAVPVTHVLVLDTNGTITAIDDVRQTSQRGRPYARRTNAPRPLANRTSTTRPHFLCDTSEYILGLPRGETQNVTARARERFRAASDLHRRYLADSDDPAAVAVRRFFETWAPGRIAQVAEATGVAPDDLVAQPIAFRLADTDHLVHERSALDAIWQEHLPEQDDTRPGQCLVTGAHDMPIVRLHPTIDLGQGRQGKLISFGDPAYRAHGHRQGFNAPVSQTAAYKYAGALQHLLTYDNGYRADIGDLVVLVWSPSAPRTHGTGNATPSGPIATLMGALGTGRQPDSDAIGDIPGPLYVLGLAYTARSRIGVQLWGETTADDLLANLRAHHADMGLDRRALWSKDQPAIADFLDLAGLETAHHGQRARFIGPLLDAILHGRRYPDALAQRTINQLRHGGRAAADARRSDDASGRPYRLFGRDADLVRAALVRGWLVRRQRHAPDSRATTMTEEALMTLDPDNIDPAYRLGRLFATLENAQVTAAENTPQRTIRDTQFGHAIAAPAAAFPRLIRMGQHHTAKIRRGQPGLGRWFEQCIDDIIAGLHEPDAHQPAFPRSLDLEGQGRFILGYYHQREAQFTPKQRRNDNQAPTATMEATQ